MPGLNNPYDFTQQFSGGASGGGALSNPYGGGSGNNPYGGYIQQMLQRRQQQQQGTYADAMTKIRELMAQMVGLQKQQGALSTPTPAMATAKEPPQEDVTDLYNQGDYFKNLGTTEAGTKAAPEGDYTVVNPASGAGGKYQFITKTWDDLSKKYPDLALTSEGRTSDTKEGRAQQERAVRALTKENIPVLKETLGRAPTHSETYIAHLLGPGYGSAVLKNNETPVEALVPAAFIAANPFLKGITGKQLVSMFAKKFR